MKSIIIIALICGLPTLAIIALVIRTRLRQIAKEEMFNIIERGGNDYI